MCLDNNLVAVNTLAKAGYPQKIPFDPPAHYPEYGLSQIDPSNQVYSGIRDTLCMLGMDKAHYGTPEWNPLGELIKPGMTVFLKPNTCTHVHENNKDILSAILHASVLRPILDYVCIALHGNGRIIVGDSQLIFGKFDKAIEKSKIGPLIDWYRTQIKIPIECFDLRTVRGVRTWLYGKWGRKPVNQDPRGYRFVDLGPSSCFKNIDPKRLRIAVASYKNMYKHHSNGKHEYLFPGSVLDSDVIISMPKLKTHRRTAITLALKNFMGMPAWKDTLPHFITGSVAEGGDQYINPCLRKRICTRLHDEIQSNTLIPLKFLCAVIKKLVWNSNYIYPFKDAVYEAMWYGNDTLWRTLLDLNRAVFYADRTGKICDTPQRQCFFLIDGIIAGEGDGPLSPDPVAAGALIAGYNPAAVDAVAGTLMGFDTDKIPLIQKALQDSTGPSPIFHGLKETIQVIDRGTATSFDEYCRKKHFSFEPHPAWKGHVEMKLQGKAC